MSGTSQYASSTVLNEHDHRTISTLIGKIESGLEEIKSRSISSLYTKLKSGIVTAQQLCMFQELPGVCLNWINDHPGKSQLLLKVLSILQALSLEKRGCELLTQYEALQFFEEFQKHLTVRETGVEEYLRIIHPIIVSLLPTRKEQDKQQPRDIENNPSQANSQVLRQPTEESNSVPLSSDFMATVKSQPALPVRFSEAIEFIVPRTELEQNLERRIFDLSVQLKYGSKKTQFETLRLIKDFISDYPAENFRNRAELIGQLGRLIEQRIHANECSEILSMILQSLISQENNLVQWEPKPLPLNPKQQHLPTTKFQFSLKHSTMKSAYCQPLLQCIAEHFRKEWFDWLTHLEAEWCSDYVVRCLKRLPVDFLKERKPALLKIAPLLLKSRILEQEWDWFGSLGLLDAKEFRDKQETNRMRAAYCKIKGYDHHLEKFLPHRHLHNFPKLLTNLEEGVVGLAYSPKLISVYLETLLYLSIASFKEEPLKEFYEPHLKTFLSICEHPSKKVRVKLYELLLEKAYLQSNIEYLSDEFTASQLTLSLFTDERILLQLFSHSLAQPQSTVFMLELAKLLYLHHSRQVHHLFVRFVPILNVLSLLPEKKISKIAVQIIEKFNSKELMILHIMNLFNKEPITREDACKQLFDGADYSNILKLLEEVTVENKRSLKPKPLVIDEDSLINCLNIGADIKLEPSVRTSAITEITQMVERADSIPTVAINRLQFTNDGLLSEAVKMDRNHPLLSSILAFNATLAMLPYNCRLFDNKDIMLVWLRNGTGIHTTYRILVILYLNCFRNPFSDRLTERQIEQHWIMSSEKFIRVVELPTKHAYLDFDVDPVQADQATTLEQPKISSLSDVDVLLRFICSHLANQQQTFKIPFDEISPLIGSALSPHATASSLSELRSLFDLYDKKAEHFTALPPQFMSHSVPSLLNSLNRQDSDHHFNMDALRIMIVAGVGSIFPRGILQQNNLHYLEILANNSDTLFKLELFCFAVVLPEPLLEAIVKLLPTADVPVLKRVYRKLIVKCADLKKLIEGNDYTRLALFSSLLKSLQQPQQTLKLLAFQLLLDLMDKRILSEHPSIFNLTLQTILDHQDSALVIVGALKLMRRILTVEPEFELLRLEKIGVVNLMMDWLNCEALPYMCYEAALNLINVLINTPLLRKYDLVELLVRLFYRVSKSLNAKPSTLFTINQTVSLLSELSCSLLLLQMHDTLLVERLLTSTNLLETLLFVLETIGSALLKQITPFELDKILSRFAQVIHMLTACQDQFVFQLNKIMNRSLEESGEPKKVINFLTSFMAKGDSNYQRMMSRIITVWHKGHAAIDRDGIGSAIYDNLKKSNELNLISSVLAVSNSAKERFASSEDFEKFISRALVVVDGAFVEDLKESKQAKKKEDISVSRVSLRALQNEPMTIKQILLLLQSFFHVCQHSSCEVKISGNLVLLIEKLFQVTSTKRRQQDFVEFKKMITNLSCNKELAKEVFACLLNTKSQFIPELIAVCGRSDEQFNNVLKQSLQVLSLFIEHAEIRALVYRTRLLHDFSAKLQRTLDAKSNPNLLHEPAKIRYLNEIIRFMLTMSAHKDSHTKLVVMLPLKQTDKHLFDELVLLCQAQDPELRELSINVLMLLANLSYSKHNKTLFINNKELHRAIMATLTSPKAHHQQKKFMLQLLYNLLYKSAAAIKIYKRKEVLTELTLLNSTFAKQTEQKETLERIVQILTSDYS